nr:hypothetical protein [Nitrosomonas nitrosa]
MDSRTENFLRTITSWFKNHEGGGLVLPSGWFGRPHDNFHRLSLVEATDGKLVIALDESEATLRLTFINLKNVDSVKVDEIGGLEELRFNDFEKLIFERKDYAGTQTRTDVFSSGTVKFISSPGT